MKKAVIISSIEEALDIKDLIDAYIVPIDKFSINYKNTFTLKDIKKLSKEVFVIVNKNIHNNELEKLKQLLIKIDKLNIKGILFYDMAIIKLKEKLNLKTPLVWAQEHLSTNYHTINFYSKYVDYVLLSAEITKEEMDEIVKNTSVKTMVQVFGYIPMFTSRRHLVNNYLDYFNLKENGKGKYIEKEGKRYPIIDTENGTVVFSNYILNSKKDFSMFDYTIYNSYLIENKELKKVLKGESTLIEENGFLDIETIYKVKKND